MGNFFWWHDGAFPDYLNTSIIAFGTGGQFFAQEGGGSDQFAKNAAVTMNMHVKMILA